MKYKKVRIVVFVAVAFFLLYAVLTSAEGVTIKHMSPIGEMSDGDQVLARAFNRYHPDIKVKVDPMPYWEVLKRAYLDWAVKAGEYDSFQLASIWLYAPANEGHLVALDTIVDLNEIGWDDYYPYERDSVSWKGHIWGFPHHGGTLIMYYRKDLLEDPVNKTQFRTKYGYELKTPDTYTWDQLLDVAQFFNRPEQNLYGIAISGQRGQMLGFMLEIWMDSHRISMLDENDVPQLNTSTAISFVKYYKELLKYAGPGAYARSFDVGTTGFLHGEYVFIMQAADLIPRIRDPEQCVLDPSQVGFALPPKGKGGVHVPPGWGLSLAMNSYGKHKKETLQWMKFAVTRNIEYSLYAAPTRRSTCEHPRLQAVFPGLEFIGKAYAAAKTAAKVIPIDEFYDTLGLRVNQVLIGELTAEEAMRKAQKEIYDILVEAGQFKK